MAFHLLVNSTDIDHHAGLLDTRHRLPLLIRKLVQQTTPSLRQNQFRTDEGVQLGGWDGLVETDQATAHVPAGESGWELGATKAVKGKADGDYKERKKGISAVEAAKMTFVFVTPRRWGGRDKWVAAKRKENFWKNVVALDADNLGAWLEAAPGVHIWLSNEMGKYPGGVTDLTTWWEDWLAETNGRVNREMLLAGRESTMEQIEQWLRSDQESFALEAGTRGEAIAVLVAIILGLPDAERAAWLDRVVIVRSLEGWRQLAVQESGLLLVPEFSEPLGDNGGGALRRHRLLLPLDSATLPTGQDVTRVVPIQVNRLRSALEQAGITQPEVDELALLGRRSFTEFRRRWLRFPAATPPSWATAASGQTLLPALLVGAWEDGNEADREVVAQLASIDYSKYRSQLVEWMHSPAPPVREVAGTWFVIDKGGAWERLRRLAPPDLLARFAATAHLVLGPAAPRVEARPDDDFVRASQVGKRQHSPRLRQALADTLALLGADDEAHAASHTTRNALYELFEQATATGDGKGWAAFGSNIRLLAEAAPDLFLEAVLTDLKSARPVLMGLFKEEDGLLFSHSDHTGLLWALEALAWNPDYLPDAARALAQLARLDPGGKLMNRPGKSLREIFLLWHPQTTADSSVRFEVIDQLRRTEPTIAWLLLLHLLPKHHDVGNQNAMPRWRWRDWNARQPGPTPWDSLFQDYARLTDRVLEDAGQDSNRWAALTDQLAEWLRYVSQEHRERILTGLETVAASDLTEESRSILRTEVQELLAHHRRAPGLPWAMPIAILGRLDVIYIALQPVDVVERTAWLFTQWPKLPEGRKGKGHEEGTRETEAVQDAALAEVYEADGLEAVLRLAARAPEPFYVGRTVLRTAWGQGVLAEWLTRFLASADGWQENLAEGLVSVYTSNTPREDAELFGLAHAQNWTPAQVARFFARLPTDARTWELIERLGADVVAAYWQWVLPYWIQPADVEVAVRQLLTQRRPASALDLLWHAVYQDERPEILLVIDALESLLQVGIEHDRIRRNDSYQLQQLIEYLDEDSGANRVRVLRLAFLLKKVFYCDGIPKIISRELSRNPALFVELHLAVYSLKEEPERPVMEYGSLEFVRWESAYDILHNWDTLPGTGTDGQIDITTALSWIAEVRRLAAPVNRLDLCDSNIGQLLARTKPGLDNVWPQVAVCEIIDRIDSAEVRRGIDTGRYNLHGRAHAVTAGAREESIASDYRAAAQVRRAWPLTARALRRLADTFERMAGREEQEADLREQTEW